MSRLLRITALTGALFCFAVFVRADSPEISIEQLIKALDDENLRRGASIALAKRKKQVVPALRKSLASNHRNRRVWAAFTLGEIGPAANSAVEDLTHSLEHEDDALRAATAQAIGKIGPAARSSVRALADSLGDENADVRRKSIAALGRVGPLAGKAAPELINSLKDAEVRQAAKDALIQIGEPAVAALREALNDDALRFDVREILRQIDPGQPGAGQPVLADLASLRAALHDLTRSPRERTAAAAELASLDKPGVAVLIEAFEKEVIASAASKAFATVGPSALDALIVALAHEKPGVRAAAADAVGRIGPEARKAIPHLTRMFQDDDHDARLHAVRALDALGREAVPAVPDLIQVMLDSKQREPARQWAIMTLVNILPDARDAVVKALIQASRDKGNYGVSSLARQQLRKIDPKAAEAAGIR